MHLTSCTHTPHTHIPHTDKTDKTDIHTWHKHIQYVFVHIRRNRHKLCSACMVGSGWRCSLASQRGWCHHWASQKGVQLPPIHRKRWEEGGGEGGDSEERREEGRENRKEVNWIDNWWMWSHTQYQSDCSTVRHFQTLKSFPYPHPPLPSSSPSRNILVGLGVRILVSSSMWQLRIPGTLLLYRTRELGRHLRRRTWC